MSKPTREDVIRTLQGLGEDFEWADLNVPIEWLEAVCKQAADRLEEQQALIDLALQYIDNECTTCDGLASVTIEDPGNMSLHRLRCKACSGTGFKSIKLAALIKKYKWVKRWADEDNKA